MSKQKRTQRTIYVDNAKERFMKATYMDKLKDVGLFLLVAGVLTWLILGVF